jgi:hypothetical protein
LSCRIRSVIDDPNAEPGTLTVHLATPSGPVGVGQVVDVMQRLSAATAPMVFHDEADGLVELRWVDGDQVVDVMCTLTDAYQFDRAGELTVWQLNPADPVAPCADVESVRYIIQARLNQPGSLDWVNRTEPLKSAGDAREALAWWNDDSPQNVHRCLQITTAVVVL